MDAKVRDVMTPGPIGVDYHQSIGDAARTMRDWGVGAVLVVNDQSLYGLITDRDLVVRAVAEAKGADEPVGPLSSGDLIGVDVDADAGEAARLMRENAVRRLPVIEDGQVAGMVSLGDLARGVSIRARRADPVVLPRPQRVATAGSAQPDQRRRWSTMTKMRDIMSAAPVCMAAGRIGVRRGQGHEAERHRHGARADRRQAQRARHRPGHHGAGASREP